MLEGAKTKKKTSSMQVCIYTFVLLLAKYKREGLLCLVALNALLNIQQ